MYPRIMNNARLNNHSKDSNAFHQKRLMSND